MIGNMKLFLGRINDNFLERMFEVSTYNFQFRKTFEVLFHGTVNAKNEKEADKKLRKFAKNCFPEDFTDYIDADCDFRPEDDGDDFVVWKETK